MIYEYRAYYVVPGRMPDIQRRFADITMKLFAKHGIRVVGFWDTVIGESPSRFLCPSDDLVHRHAPGRLHGGSYSRRQESPRPTAAGGTRGDKIWTPPRSLMQ